MSVSGPDGSSFASCPCGCKKSAPASSWYFGLTKCDTGKNTAQDWLDTFKTKELVKAVKAKAAPKKKSAESSSKSSTPTKDGDNADKPDNADDANNAASDEEVKEKKSAKKQKVEKEPKTPKAKKEAKSDDEKKPLSSYFIFCAAKRAEAKEVADSKPCTAAGLSEMWKNTSEEDRKPFQDQADELKAAYNAKKIPTESAKKKTAKASKPLTARSGYIIFGVETRGAITEEFPGIKATEILKLLGSKWKELTPEAKKVFEDKAAAEKVSVAAGNGRIDGAGSKRKSSEDESDDKEHESAEKDEDKDEEKDEDEEKADEKEEEEEETEGVKASQAADEDSEMKEEKEEKEEASDE